MEILEILKLFEANTIENYNTIITKCDEEINQNAKSAEAYFLRGMAKFGIALSLKMDLKLLSTAVPIGIASNFGTAPLFTASTICKKKMDKIEGHYKIADSAVQDYEYAKYLNSNIDKQFKDLKLKGSSDFVNAEYIFYRPITSKELVNLLAANRKWSFLLFFLFLWFILPIILFYFYGDGSGNMSNTGVIIELIGTAVLIFFVFAINNIDTNILKKYGDKIIINSK